MKFISLKKSNKPNKKLVITFSEPDLTIHFGSKNSSTFLDHYDKVKRSNYHLGITLSFLECLPFLMGPRRKLDRQDKKHSPNQKQPFQNK